MIKNNIKCRDEIYIDFIKDSQKYIFKENFDLDFFMEIFKACYTQKESKFLIYGFKFEKSYISLNFNYNNYSKIINLIDNIPNFKEKYLTEEDDRFNYYVKLYTIIFYLRYKFDKEKAEQMFFQIKIYIHILLNFCLDI